MSKQANEPHLVIMKSYERDCPHCYGEGMVEHIEENIAEDCGYCSGTGRALKLSDSEIMANNIISYHLSNH